jgi:hypothetical protein
MTALSGMPRQRTRAALVGAVRSSGGEPPATHLKPERKSVSVKAVA